MQYPYLTLLEIITILLTLLIGITIFYFLVKKWRETKFLTALKTMTLYELGSLLIYLIYPFPLLSRISGVSVFKILDVLIFSIILFLIFYFVMKKFLSLSWKKSLVAFLFLIILLFPLLSFLRRALMEKIWDFSVFSEEKAKIGTEMKTYIKEYGFGCLLDSPLRSSFCPAPFEPLALRIIGTIEKATLSWPSVRYGNLMTMIKAR